MLGLVLVVLLMLLLVLESGLDLTNESPDRSTMLRQGLEWTEKYYNLESSQFSKCSPTLSFIFQHLFIAVQSEEILVARFDIFFN